MSIEVSVDNGQEEVFRAVDRGGSPEVIGIGVPGALRASAEDRGIDLADVILYRRSTEGRPGDRVTNSAEILGAAAPLRNSLRTQEDRDAAQERVNALWGGDHGVLHAEIIGLADAAHVEHPQYRGHWEGWAVGRMQAEYESCGSTIREGDVVLFKITEDDRYSPVTVYAVRAGVDVGIDHASGDDIAPSYEEEPLIQMLATPGGVANVRMRGVVIGSVARIEEDSFVASAYPTDAGTEYTIGGSDTFDEAVGAVLAEWKGGWRK